MFQRLWVQIPAPYTGCNFFHIPICCKICNVGLKRPKINKKRPGWPILKKLIGSVVGYQRPLQNHISLAQPQLRRSKQVGRLGRGGGGRLVVSLLAFYSNDPSLNPAKDCSFLCKILFENNENGHKEAGVGPLKKQQQIDKCIL